MPSGKLIDPKIDKWLEENQGKHLCGCGCGRPIKILRWHHWAEIPKYIRGHFRDKPKTILINKWIKENQGKHFCHCGCNGVIKILRVHYRDGIPKYIRGHYATTDKDKKRKSEIYSGSGNPFYDKTHSEEVKLGMSEKRKGKCCGKDNPNYGGGNLSDDARKRISDAMTLLLSTDEGRERMRQQRLNQKFSRVSSIEIKIQDILRLHGYFFQTQIPICKICIPDIVFPDRQIIIQCDGDYWHNYPDGNDIDHKQDEILTKNGWRVIRFWEHEINNNIQNCLRKFESIYNDTEYTPYYTQGTLDDWI